MTADAAPQHGKGVERIRQQYARLLQQKSFLWFVAVQKDSSGTGRPWFQRGVVHSAAASTATLTLSVAVAACLASASQGVDL